MEMTERAREAVCKYLDMKGYEIVDENFQEFVVFEDGITLAFARVSYEIGEMPTERNIREEFEHVMACYLVEHPEVVNREIRCDDIAIHVVDRGRALLRHHRNCIAG